MMTSRHIVAWFSLTKEARRGEGSEAPSVLVHIGHKLLISRKWRQQSGCNDRAAYCCLPNFGPCEQERERQKQPPRPMGATEK